MELRLYDTFTRSLRVFEPLRPPEVGMYTCGPTVYNYAHIGNLRTYIFEDVLRRALVFNGWSVKHVMNSTDVGHLLSDADEGDDKAEHAARRQGKSAWEIAEFYAQAFKEDLERLNILQPTIWCKATEHIQEQIELVQCIEAKGYTYRTSDGIYFDTSKLEDYGYMARLDVEGLRAGARVRLGEKRNPTDFALWKFSPPDVKRQMEWESPWGVGFPGWHIECTAMSVKYLGPFFDIHCGGEDHINVHHVNEIAQAEACYGTRLANFWLHGYFLQLDTGRMGKSLGNFLRVQDLIDRGYDPLAYRYLCLGAHYRSRLTFSWDALGAASKALTRLREMVYGWEGGGSVSDTWVETFLKQVNDDLNMPRALATVWEVAHSDLSNADKKATLLKLDEVLGLRLAEWQPEAIPEEILRLVEKRQEARRARRWAEADALRDQILAAGYEVRDTPEGPVVRRRP
ncbi:MAG TPA: cysteine--tRNA ligase [Chloroflexi bacterium]|nr:cysteine--tRNA ligase [Chloroflexota bacterium]